MRKELIDLMHFLKSVYVMDSRTIHTCSHIDDKIMRNYANTIEKILSNDVILVDKNELEHKFKDVPIDIKSDYLIVQKDFNLHSQIRIMPSEYIAVRSNKDFQEYFNKTLTYNLLNYFINEVGVKEDRSE